MEIFDSILKRVTKQLTPLFLFIILTFGYTNQFSNHFKKTIVTSEENCYFEHFISAGLLVRHSQWLGGNSC